jgi:hypothetical protein
MNEIIKKVYKQLEKFIVPDIGQVRPNFKGKIPKGMTFRGYFRIPLDMLSTKSSHHVLSNIRAVVSEHKNDLVSLIESGLWREGAYIPPTVIVTFSGKIVLLTGEHTYQAFYDQKSNDLFVALVEFDTYDNAKTWQSNENANLEYVKRGRDDDQVTQTTKEILHRRIRKGLINKSNIDEMEKAILEILKDQDVTVSTNGLAKVTRLINQVLQYYNDDIEVVKNYTEEEFKNYFVQKFSNMTLSNGKIVLNDNNSIILSNSITANESGINILRWQQKMLKTANYIAKMNYPIDEITILMINHFVTANSKEYYQLKQEDKLNTRLKDFIFSIENFLKYKNLFLKAKKHSLPQLKDQK